MEISDANGTFTLGGESEWTVDALHGYPANERMIQEYFMRLSNLKAGPTAIGVTNAATTTVSFKDSSGKELAKLKLGDLYRNARLGGIPDGRYFTVDGTPVIVDDALDAFGSGPLAWVSTSILPPIHDSHVKSISITNASEGITILNRNGYWAPDGLGPNEYPAPNVCESVATALFPLNFSGIAEPQLTEEDLGLTTGSVYTATLFDGVSYTATIGNNVGSNTALRISASFSAPGAGSTDSAAYEKMVNDFNENAGKWTYLIPSSSADRMTKTRSDLVKSQDRPL